MAAAGVCPHTGLTIPECSCPACTRRILAEMAAGERGRRRPVAQRRRAPGLSREWAEALRFRRGVNADRP